MAAYGIIRYNQLFSKAAAVSPAVGLAGKQIMKEMACSSFLDDNRIFLSWGTREGAPRFMGYYKRTVLQLEKALQVKGFCTYIYEYLNGQHNEACWEQEIGTWMHFLWES